MDSNKAMFTDMEIDAIGEVLNISMGAAATAVSTLLNKKVYITTPKVELTQPKNLEYNSLTPGVGVEINYIEGLDGVNIFILKQDDVKHIVSILLQTEFDPNEEFVMDEISVSAICETMNQMMGSSSTALAQFLNKVVNISTPTPFEVNPEENISTRYFDPDNDIISVKFNLNIEDTINSEFLSVMSCDFAQELISYIFNSGDSQILDNEQAVEESNNNIIEQPSQVPVQQVQAPVEQHIEQPIQAPVQQQEVSKPSEPQPVYNVSPPSFNSFSNQQSVKLDEQPENLKLIMSVPLKITAELGHSTQTIKDILSFSDGSIIDLDKQAGMPVDILVNGQKIAKGDVVVVEDYYGVRITEILKPSEIMRVL